MFLSKDWILFHHSDLLSSTDIKNTWMHADHLALHVRKLKQSFVGYCFAN
jgi:hypothetical protein